MCLGLDKFIHLIIYSSLLHSVISNPAGRQKRSIYGLDSNGPYLPAPFGPVPFAPFGLGSPFAQPPFALPYSPYAPPPYAAPNTYPLPPWFPPHPYQNPIFSQPPPGLYRPPYFPPVVAPAAPAGPPPAPIIVPAKTAAALSIASIIHAFIARKFYPPVLPVPIARPVVPVPLPVPERAQLSPLNQKDRPVTVLKPTKDRSPAFRKSSDSTCNRNVSNHFPQLTYVGSFTGQLTTSTEAPWQPTIIPIQDKEGI